MGALSDNKSAQGSLIRLAEAFQSCQAEQGRTIDTLFGQLIGRDATLEDQVLTLVDSVKALAMEAVVHELNPHAAGTDDGNPSGQAPHITSAYLEAVGAELGLRGTAAASSDPLRPQNAKPKKVAAAFRAQFSLDPVVDAIIGDVNQQGAEVQRIVDRDLLAKWASQAAATSGFDAHSTYFDEGCAHEYEGRPADSEAYQPFLSRKVTLCMLVHLFTPPVMSMA